MTQWKLVPVEPTEEMIAAIQDAAFAAWDAVVASEFNDDLPTYPPTYIQQQAWKAALDAAPEAPSAEPVAWMTVEEDGTRHGLRGWSDGTHREAPLYMAPPAPTPQTPVGRVAGSPGPMPRRGWPTGPGVEIVRTGVDPERGSFVDYKVPPAPNTGPVAWQWLDTKHFRKKVPAGAEAGAWRPLYAHPAPSVEPCPYIRSSAEGTHWCALAAQPPDHREAMRQAIEALRNAHAYSVTHAEFEDGVLDVIDTLQAALGGRND